MRHGTWGRGACLCGELDDTSQNRLLAVAFAVWLFSNGSRSACTETDYRKERETGLEPAIACLEGRRTQNRRSPDLHRLSSRFIRFTCNVSVTYTGSSQDSPPQDL